MFENGPTSWTVSFDPMFDHGGGRWVVRGFSFAPEARASTRQGAVAAARRLAVSGDDIEVRNQDGTLSEQFRVQ